MHKIKEALNNFCETTTIHGLAYLSKNLGQCTRLIWLTIVICASLFAGYFLSEILAGYDTKFTTTTIEQQRIFRCILFDGNA